MTKTKINPLMRIVNILVGLLYILIAGWVLLNEDETEKTLILILSFVILFGGIVRLFNVFFEKEFSGTRRLLNFIVGSLLVILALIILGGNDQIGSDILILLLSFGLFSIGITRLILGFAESGYSGWIRIIWVIVGIASLTLSLIVFVDRDAGEDVLITLLAYGFLISGIGRIFTGIGGVKRVQKN